MGFKNLPEIQGLLAKYQIYRTAKDVGLSIPDAPHTRHVLDMTDQQQVIYDDVQAEIEALRASGETEDQQKAFGMLSQLEKIAMDLSLYDPVAFPDAWRKAPKYLAVRDAVVSRMPETKKEAKTKIKELEKQLKAAPEEERKALQKKLDYYTLIAERGGGHIIFCDYHSGGSQDRIKQLLVEAGIPADEIAIVNSKTAGASKRQEISKDFNAGKIRVVIGSSVIGEGINLQKTCTDIHHVTIPWNNAIVHQRNGRGVRQGNPADTVQLHEYVARGTYDAYKAATVMGKKGWQDKLQGGSERIDIDSESTTRMEVLIEISKDPEAARAEYETQMIEMREAFTAKKEADAIKTLSELRRMRWLYENSSPSEMNDRRQAKITQLRNRARGNQFLPAHLKAAIDEDRAGFISAKGQAFFEGQLIRRAGREYIVDAIDYRKKRIVIKSEDNVSPPVLKQRASERESEIRSELWGTGKYQSDGLYGQARVLVDENKKDTPEYKALKDRVGALEAELKKWEKEQKGKRGATPDQPSFVELNAGGVSTRPGNEADIVTKQLESVYQVSSMTTRFSSRQFERHADTMQGKLQSLVDKGGGSQYDRAPGLIVTAEGDIARYLDAELPQGATWWTPTEAGLGALAQAIASDYVEAGYHQPLKSYDWSWVAQDMSESGHRLSELSKTWAKYNQTPVWVAFNKKLNREIRHLLKAKDVAQEIETEAA